MKKKLTVLLLAMIMTLTSLVGCGSSEPDTITITEAFQKIIEENGQVEFFECSSPGIGRPTPNDYLLHWQNKGAYWTQYSTPACILDAEGFKFMKDGNAVNCTFEAYTADYNQGAGRTVESMLYEDRLQLKDSTGNKVDTIVLGENCMHYEHEGVSYLIMYYFYSYNGSYRLDGFVVKDSESTKDKTVVKDPDGFVWP